MSARTAMLWFSHPCPSYDRIVERPTVVIQDQTVLINRFEVVVIEGQDAGTRVRSTSDELSIGTNDGNHVKLSDPTVSRHHCVLHADERGLELRDLGSRNGTFLGESEIIHAYVPTATRFRVGKTMLAVDILADRLEQPLAAGDRLGSIIGASMAMRRLYPLIERCGAASTSVLINGSPRRSTRRARAVRRALSSSIAARYRTTSPSRSCSATSAERSPAPTRGGSARSSAPTAGRSFSTRSASCR
jgi:hypothetical protein